MAVVVPGSAQLSSGLESRTSKSVEKYPYERAVFVAPCRCRSTCTCINPRAVDMPELRKLVRAVLGVDARRFEISPVRDMFEYTSAVCVLGRTEMEAGVLVEAVAEFGSERTGWKLTLDSEVERIANRIDHYPARSITEVATEVFERIRRVDPHRFQRAETQEWFWWEPLLRLQDFAVALTDLGIRLPADLREEIHYYCIDLAWSPKIEQVSRYCLRGLP